MTHSLVLASLSCSQAKRAETRERGGVVMRRRCISKVGPDRLLRYSRDSTLPPSFQQHGRRWHPGSNPDCPIPDSTARQHWSLNLSLYTLLPECSASSGTRDERAVGAPTSPPQHPPVSESRCLRASSMCRFIIAASDLGIEFNQTTAIQRSALLQAWTAGWRLS